MDTTTLVRALADGLRQAPLRADLADERQLEDALVPFVQSYVGRTLGVSGDELRRRVIYHGHPDYSSTKDRRRVEVFGSVMTGDIFIELPADTTLFIEVKLAKKSLPFSLQRALGQSVLLRLKHDFVICFVALGNGTAPQGGLGEKLADELWKLFRIALVVRPLS
jgi:hypothetical protein